MAMVGQKTSHKAQLDELDAEIASMEGLIQGESQQPQPDPETVFDGQDQPTEQAEGDGTVEAITSVDEFIQHDEAGERQAPGQEQAEAVESLEESEVDEQPEPQSEEQAPTGRRSWKRDFLELENRYIKLRQASDHYKFETKQQIGGLQERLLKISEENENLKQQLVELGTAAKQQGISDIFSQDDIDVLGEGTVTSVKKAIDAAVEGATKPLQAELLRMKKAERDRLRDEVTANRSQAYQTFEQRLAELVPDYPRINVDKKFIAWLKEPSPYSGAPRLTHLHQAEAAGDVERVAQFFVEWQQLQDEPKQMLDQSVTPSGKGGGGAAPTKVNTAPQKPEEKVFSMAFINKFYDDDIAGKYKGREALRDKIDKEIDLALRDGRVV